MKYIVDAIVKSIIEQNPNSNEQLRIRISGFEDVRIYEAVAKRLHDSYDNSLAVETRLSKEKWMEFCADPRSNQTAMLSLEAHGWIAEKNSLTYYRNLSLEEAQLIVIMGTEAVDDQGGLSDFYYLDPEKLVSELVPNYYLVFSPGTGEWTEDETKCINKLFGDLFALVPINLCKFSDLADEWGGFSTIQDFVERFYEQLPVWGLCKEREKLPSISKILKSDKVNLLQTNSDFITRKLFKKMTQKQYEKYITKIAKYQIEAEEYKDDWPGWAEQSIVSLASYTDVLCQFIRGESINENRKKLLGVDFAITEYVLGITLPIIIVPKIKKYEVSGNPYIAFLKAVCASVACEDDQPFDSIKITISSIELADAVDPLLDVDEAIQLAENWKKVCWFAGGVIEYINALGFEVNGNEIDIIGDESKPFDPKCAEINVQDGLISTASSSKKLDKVRFEVTHYLQDKPTEIIHVVDWTFTLHDDWVIAFDQLCGQYEEWDNDQIDSAIPIATTDNYEALMGAKCEEEFLDSFEQSSLDFSFNLSTEALKHIELNKSYEWQGEYSALGRSFIEFCKSLVSRGFYADLLNTSKGECKSIQFVDRYVKLGNLIVNSTFPQKLEWVMDYFIHAFSIEESTKAITSGEEGTGCIIPPYHPAILQKIIDQTVFLADGCSEWLHENEEMHASFDKVCSMVDELIQLSQIQEGVDIFPGKGQFFGTTQAFANYCICGICKSTSKKWMKTIMKKDAVFDDDFNDGTFKRMSVSAKMLLDVLETYTKALPNYTSNLSIAVINPDDLQPIIAALYQYIIRAKKTTGDNGQIIQIRLYILVHPENKGGKNYLSYWANTFFNQDENVDLKIYLNEWKDKDDLDKLLDTNLDLVFLMNVLKFDRLHFARDNGSAEGKISDCRFPIVFKPAPVSAASIKRSIELTQRQFSAATIHSQVVYYEENYESFPYQRELVVREVSIDAERKELILMLHRKANWVICVDGGMDGALLRDSEGNNYDYSVIGFSTGKGPHGQYNLTITARNSIINAVETRLKARLQKAFAWDKAKTYMAAQVCMNEARNLDGVSLLSAINPRDENINEFMAYVLASLQAKKQRSESALQVVVHLDSYQHWFESNILEAEVESSSRPDFLQVSADIGDNGVIQLEATVIECKIAKYDYAEERKADAYKQVQHGIKHLSNLFDPHSKSIRRRYWFAQLYRALAFSQITFQSDTQAFRRLSEEMRNILEGNFEIKWSGKIMGYWKDMLGEEEVVSTISTAPIIELHEVPQKKIQRILLDDESASVEFAPVSDDQEDDSPENDDNDIIITTPTRDPNKGDHGNDTGFGDIPEKGNRVSFTFDEAVLLLDTLLKGKRSGWTQTTTAEEASKVLRALAQKKGDSFSDSFRSQGGLMGRLKSLSEYFNGSDSDSSISTTKVFSEVTQLYKTDPDSYSAHLEKLKKLIKVNGESEQAEPSAKPDETEENPSGSDLMNDSDDSREHKSGTTFDQNSSPVKNKKTSLEDVRVFIGKDKLGNKVYWDFGHPKLANRHLLITGTSGQGKTYSIQAMLKELAENGISSVIFDYTEGFREDQLEPAFRNALANRITQKVVYFTGIPINPFRRHEIEVGGMKAPEKVSDVAQRIATIFTHVYNFGEQQFGALYSACSDAITTFGDQTDMSKFRDKLKESSNPAAKSVLNKMNPFVDSVDFQPDATFDWNSIIQADGSVVIFQLTNYVREIQVIITEMMLWDAWHYFKKNGDKNTPFVVVLDEAQNLSMKMGSPAEIILREGRKFGWSAWFATQSLKSLSDVEVVNLHQAPYSLYFKPTDDEIVKISKQIDPVSSSSWVSYLKGLNKGQCIVTGDRVRPDGSFGAVKPTITNITSFEEREKHDL